MHKLFKLLGALDTQYRVTMHIVAKEWGKHTPKAALSYEVQEYLRGNVSLEFLEEKIRETDETYKILKGNTKV